MTQYAAARLMLCVFIIQKNEPEECVLDFKRPVKNVCAANLAETEFEALHAENNKLELELAPNKIKTIYFEI